MLTVGRETSRARGEQPLVRVERQSEQPRKGLFGMRVGEWGHRDPQGLSTNALLEHLAAHRNRRVWRERITEQQRKPLQVGCRLTQVACEHCCRTDLEARAKARKGSQHFARRLEPVERHEQRFDLGARRTERHALLRSALCADRQPTHDPEVEHDERCKRIVAQLGAQSAVCSRAHHDCALVNTPGIGLGHLNRDPEQLRSRRNPCVNTLCHDHTVSRATDIAGGATPSLPTNLTLSVPRANVTAWCQLKPIRFFSKPSNSPRLFGSFDVLRCAISAPSLATL